MAPGPPDPGEADGGGEAAHGAGRVAALARRFEGQGTPATGPPNGVKVRPAPRSPRPRVKPPDGVSLYYGEQSGASDGGTAALSPGAGTPERLRATRASQGPPKPPKPAALQIGRHNSHGGSVEVEVGPQRTREVENGTQKLADRIARLNLGDGPLPLPHTLLKAQSTPTFRTQNGVAPPEPSPVARTIAAEAPQRGPSQRRPPPPLPPHIAARREANDIAAFRPPSLIIDRTPEEPEEPSPQSVYSAPAFVAPHRRDSLDPSVGRASFYSDTYSIPGSALGSSSSLVAPPLLTRASSTSSMGTVSSDGDYSPIGVGQPDRKARKRAHVLAEIVDTERTYLSDLELLDELFASQSGVFTPSDVRTLFANLDAIISISRTTVNLLGPDPSIESVLDALVGPDGSRAAEIEAAYAEYCKRHDGALSRLAEIMDPSNSDPQIKEFILGQTAMLRGRTGAWDLPSLLVKPVQRVLKFPLLLKALLSATHPDDPFISILESALERYTTAAEAINEIRRRKEVTEKVARQESSRNVAHWTSKTISRATRQVREVTGLAGQTTVDSEYDALVSKFSKREAMVRTLQKEARAWSAASKAAAEALESVGITVMEFATMGGQNGDSRVRVAASRLSQGCREAEKTIEGSIIPALDRLVELHKNPSLVIKKRDRKRIDYDRARELREKGQADPALDKSSDQYEALHAQLLEELPRFLELSCRYIGAVAACLMKVQASCVGELRGLGGAWATWDGVRAGWSCAFERAVGNFEGLSTADPWRLEALASTTTEPKRRGPRRTVSGVRPEVSASRTSSFASTGTGGVSSPFPDRSSIYQTVLAQPSPTPSGSRNGFEAACVFPYHSPDLSLHAGEIVTVELADEQGGWYWVETKDGRQGWVEVHHLERI